MRINRVSALRVGALVFILTGMLMASAPVTAHAGFFDRVKDIFSIPGEVDKLKENYEEVKENYDATVEKYNETSQQLEETRRQAEEYRQLQEELMADNSQLQEENRKLAEAVQELKDSEEARNRQTERIKRVVWTAVLLVFSYFAVTRVARIIMRARARNG